MTDDLSILGSVIVYRRIQAVYLDFDTNGNAVIADGAFRTKELSVFRCDRVTETEVLKGYPNGWISRDQHLGHSRCGLHSSLR